MTYRIAARDLDRLLRDDPAHQVISDTAPPDANLRNAGDLGAPAEAALGQAASEHDEQVALFAWAAMNEAQHPELACMFAIPNGGARHPAVAAQLKAEGVRAGVPDCFLAVRRGKWGGLFIEMKRRPNKPTTAQQEWIARLRNSGEVGPNWPPMRPSAVTLMTSGPS